MHAGVLQRRLLLFTKRQPLPSKRGAADPQNGGAFQMFPELRAPSCYSQTWFQMVSITVEFYATVCCRLCHYNKLPWREIKTKNGLQALTKAKQRKCQVRELTTVQPARPLQRPATKATTKNGLQALKKATQRKEASGKSISQIQASSYGNTYKSKHKLRGGAGKTTRAKTRHKKNA